jgi:DNA-directed RNA polymerase specialized sigma24 family protein
MSEKAWEQQLSMQLEKTNSILKALLALELEDSGKNLIQKVELLSAIGMTPSEIAETLGTTAHNVSVQLSKARKRKGEVQDDKESTSPAV